MVLWWKTVQAGQWCRVLLSRGALVTTCQAGQWCCALLSCGALVANFFFLARLDKAKFFGVGTGLFTGVTLLLYPSLRDQNRLQISSLPPPPPSPLSLRCLPPTPQPSMFQVARTIARTEGVPGFYRGLTTVIAGTPLQPRLTSNDWTNIDSGQAV